MFAGSAQAAIGPLYDVRVGWGDTNFPPGGKAELYLQVSNIGDAVAEADLEITDELPSGVKIESIDWPREEMLDGGLTPNCSGVGTSTLTCVMPGSDVVSLAKPLGNGVAGPGGSNLMPSGHLPLLYIDVEVEPGVSGTGTNTATVSGGGASVSRSDVDQIPFSSNPAQFGLVPGSFLSDAFAGEYPIDVASRRAGGHPFEQRVNFDLTQESGIDESGSPSDGTRYTGPHGLIRDAEVTLPRGFIGNPEATPKCDPVDFSVIGASANSAACPPDTQVGYINIWFYSGVEYHGQGSFRSQLGEGELSRVAIYNLEPPKGVPADFGFVAGGGFLAHIYPELDPTQNYAIKTVSPDISSFLSPRGTEVTFWGVPADSAHDRFRYYREAKLEIDETGEFPEVSFVAAGAPWGSAAIRPFFTNPSDCGFDNGGARIRLDSYSSPGSFTPTEEHGDAFNVQGCDDPRFRFEPDIGLQPTDRHAGAPTGLNVELEVPQRNDVVTDPEFLYEDSGSVKGISTPPIKKAVVTLPEGMTISPSAAQGLGSCSAAQIGLGTNTPVKCPDSSQYGTITMHTPLFPVDAPLQGFVYIAKQNDNPFHNFLSLYLVIEEPERGILVKIPGRADLDPSTGQIKTTFDDLPQFPVSSMELTFKGGARAALVNPTTCGSKTITAEFFSWHDPGTGNVVTDSYPVTERPDGTPCVADLGQRPFGPQFEAGTTNNTGGSYSPFAFRLTRSDDDQEFSQVGVTLPPGLAAKFAGVSMCSEPGIAQAEARNDAGDGGLEQSSPSCPVSSLIGTTQVGTGVGVPLSYVPGNVYLAGPYKGAPLSMVVISPAVVGPYDLGVIAVRTALRVDPVTVQGSAFSDPLPQIFQGIPVRIRDIRLNLDRPGFTLNPTSCAPKQIDAHIIGTGGDVSIATDDTTADLQRRFQAADCASLGFEPRLAFRLFGSTKRGSHPKLQATVTYPKAGAYANIAAASVALPHSEFLDQQHIRTVCTKVQFAAQQCPAGSVYGHAVAKTPLFDTPLEGPVYLRSSSNPLPDMVVVLKGPAAQPVEVHLVGRIDSVHGGIRNTFDLVPDAPVESFKLTLQGGKKGLLVNSRDLCKSTSRATAKFRAQNGKLLTLRPALQNSCKKAGGKQKRRLRH